MPRSKTKRLATSFAVAAVLGAGAGIGLAQAGGDDPPSLWAPEPTGSAVPATAAQKAAYGVLASTQRTQDGANDQVETLAARSGVGMDADGARVVGATDDGPIWLIPANGGLCLGLEDTGDGSIGAACEPSDDVIARGMTVGDGTAIYGVAPDGVTSVDVTPDGGSAGTVAVDGDGVYTLPNATATVGVDGPGGLTEFGVQGHG